jgi:hypothetical protein
MLRIVTLLLVAIKECIPMVILTDRELAFLVTLKADGERLYRNELARLLQEEAVRRSRVDVKGVRPGETRIAV